MNTDDKIVTFESYYDPMLAHIVRTRLEDNGIPCFIADDNTIGANPLYNQAVGGLRLNVFERDLPKCREILSANVDLHEQNHVEIDAETNVPVLCPYCASTNVRFGNATVDRYGWMSIIISMLLFCYPFYSKKAWHCFNCHRDFE